MTEYFIKSLFTVGAIAWWLDLAALIICVIIGIKNKAINSSIITLCVVVVTSGIMVGYAPYLLSLKKELGDTGYYFAWYIGFTVIDMIAIFCLLLWHKNRQLKFEVMANYVLGAFFALAGLQLLRYLDRLVLHTDFIPLLYRYGVMAINYSTSFVTVGLTLLAMLSAFNIQLGNKQFKWSL